MSMKTNNKVRMSKAGHMRSKAIVDGGYTNLDEATVPSALFPIPFPGLASVKSSREQGRDGVAPGPFKDGSVTER